VNFVDHYITLDLSGATAPGTVYVRSLVLGHRLCVTLANGQTEVQLPASTEGLVQLVYELPDSTIKDAPGYVKDNAAVVILPREMTENEGDVRCEIRVYSGDGTWTASPQFTVQVRKTIFDEDAMDAIVNSTTVYEKILASEAARIAGENSRAAAEEARAQAEAARAAAEAARVAAEAARDAALALKQDKLTWDETPVSGSGNPVTSRGIYNAIAQAEIGPTVDIDDFVQQYQLEAALAEKAAATHTHAAADVASGTLGVARGGTGGGTKEAACDGLKALFMEAGTTTQIDDMNELTTPGSYCVINNNVAHGPMGNLGMVGRVFVVEIRSGDYVQFALTGWSLYVRLFSQALSDEYQFGEWVEISGVITDWNKYLDGDKYSLPNKCYLPVHGMYASSTKNIVLSVYVPKSLEKIQTATVTKLKGAMRGVQGYIDGSTTNTNWLTATGVTVSAVLAKDRYVKVVVNKDGFTNIVNDSPVEFSVTDLEIEFSET